MIKTVFRRFFKSKVIENASMIVICLLKMIYISSIPIVHNLSIVFKNKISDFFE